MINRRRLLALVGLTPLAGLLSKEKLIQIPSSSRGKSVDPLEEARNAKPVNVTYQSELLADAKATAPYFQNPPTEPSTLTAKWVRK